MPSRETPTTFPPSKTQSGRQPGERLASAKWWKRRQRTRGSNATRVFNHGEAESPKNAVNRAIVSGWRSARVHQPADADCAPDDSRQPGERLASAKWWKRRQRTRGSNATRVFDHGEAVSRKNAVNRAFASGWRPARVHQPADAGRSPDDTQAWPKPARSRTRTTRPGRLFVDRSHRWDAVGLTNRVRRKSSCAGARLLGLRAARTAWEDGGRAVLQVGSPCAGHCSNRLTIHRNRHPRMSTPRAIDIRTKQP